jgi:hypothetical protein
LSQVRLDESYVPKAVSLRSLSRLYESCVVDVNADDLSLRPDDLRSEQRYISHSRADVEDPLPGAHAGLAK